MLLTRRCSLNFLASFPSGRGLLPIDVLPKHGHLMKQLCQILVDGGILGCQGNDNLVKATKVIDPTPAASLYELYSNHASETNLLNVTASRLPERLAGKQELLALLFANKATGETMSDVYNNPPMRQATTRLLAGFWIETMSSTEPNRVFPILQVGAGIGRTARDPVNDRRWN